MRRYYEICLLALVVSMAFMSGCDAGEAFPDGCGGDCDVDADTDADSDSDSDTDSDADTDADSDSDSDSDPLKTDLVDATVWGYIGFAEEFSPSGDPRLVGDFNRWLYSSGLNPVSRPSGGDSDYDYFRLENIIKMAEGKSDIEDVLRFTERGDSGGDSWADFDTHCRTHADPFCYQNSKDQGYGFCVGIRVFGSRASPHGDPEHRVY